MESSDKIRIDKWLYAVRIFKTRTLAANACHAGKVRINNKQVKASRSISPGEVITIQKRFYKQTCRVINLVEKRISAKLTPDYMEDLTPETELEIRKAAFSYPVARRNRGEGRPTKKERRQMQKFKDIYK